MTTHDEKTLARIEALKAEADTVDAEYKRVTGPLRDRMQTIQAELDQYRTKCDGCRCRLLPGEVCQCCAGREGLMALLRQAGAEVMDGDDDGDSEDHHHHEGHHHKVN